jgi:hypothetical protein
MATCAKLEFALLVCFGLIHAWYVHGTVVGRHAETGETLSANHVFPVGDVTHEVRC